MSKTNNKPGIHLHKDFEYKVGKAKPVTYWYWHAIAPNGRITANGETYSRKAIALNSIRSTSVTMGGKGKFKYYDHSKPNSPLQSYL